MEEWGNTEFTETASGATLDIPWLSDPDLANWHLVAVGGAHVVFRYLGFSPELRLTVLKVRKQRLTTGWTLRLGLALVLKELRGAATAASEHGGGEREQTTSGLYSLIPAKYLPLQKVVRVPQSVADCFLLRAACESPQSQASRAHSQPAHVDQVEYEGARCFSPRRPSSKSATDCWQPSGGISLQGIGPGSAYQEELSSWRGTESYVLCLLEEDLLTTPVRGSATANMQHQAASEHASVQTSSGFKHIPLSTLEVANSQKSSVLELYYSVELKPKCGLLEPLDHQEPTESAESPEDQPASSDLKELSPRPCLLLYDSSNRTSKQQVGQACTATASQKSARLTAMSKVCGMPHFFRDQRHSLGNGEATGSVAPEERMKQEKPSVSYFRANRFQMQQYLKLRKGHISRPSLYNPVQFFKCTPCTIRRELLNLMENPQNNLVTFLNGSRIRDFGKALETDSEASSSPSSGIVGRMKCARADNFVRLLLERIWERAKNLFSGILVLQAFAAGQQHLSVKLVRELKRVLGKTYEKLAEENLSRSVDLYTEAASRDTVSLHTTFAFSEVRSSDCVASSHSPADISRTSPETIRTKAFPSMRSMHDCGRGALGTNFAPTASMRPLNFVAAERVQCAHEREGFEILSSLKALGKERGDEKGAEINNISSVVEAAFQWLRQYLLGRTFMDVSVITNILILDEGSPIASRIPGADDVAALTSRFERLELDGELAASAALLLEDQLGVSAFDSEKKTRSSQNGQITYSRLPLAVFFRVTTTDMDFKSESRIEEWSTKWTEIQRAYFQVQPEGL